MPQSNLQAWIFMRPMKTLRSCSPWSEVCFSPGSGLSFRPVMRHRSDPEAALLRFRSLVDEAWAHRDAVAAQCGERHAALLDSLERLRYAEEHGVRHQAVELTSLRRRVRTNKRSRRACEWHSNTRDGAKHSLSVAIPPLVFKASTGFPATSHTCVPPVVANLKHTPTQ